MTRKKIISGIRATGPLHLGNFHGALSNWVLMQDRYQCSFFVANWHALTTGYSETNSISSNVKAIMLDWLSVGLDPEKSTLFVQSLVPEHAELYLYLSMITPTSWLERNPTYKEQIIQIKNMDISTHGFIGYPVIQAADILMYKADFVPIGVDQVPHIEITREIARKFNKTYGEIFPEPKEILTDSPKILGTDRRKMSKSYDNAIYLSDSSDDILEKVSKMITDPQRKRKTDPGNPSICNVYEFHKMYSHVNLYGSISHMCKKAEIGCVECKKIVARNLIDYIAPFKENREKFKKSSVLLEDIIYDGSKKARKTAKKTIDEVREVMKIKI